MNSSAIHRKEELFLDLGAAVIALAETSAVESVQTICASNVRKAGFQTHFGEAVSAHGRDTDKATALRGFIAGGVALATKLYSRPSPTKHMPSLGLYDTHCRGNDPVWKPGSSLHLLVRGPAITPRGEGAQ